MANQKTYPAKVLISQIRSSKAHLCTHLSQHHTPELGLEILSGSQCMKKGTGVVLTDFAVLVQEMERDG